MASDRSKRKKKNARRPLIISIIFILLNCMICVFEEVHSATHTIKKGNQHTNDEGRKIIKNHVETYKLAK